MKCNNCGEEFVFPILRVEPEVSYSDWIKTSSGEEYREGRITGNWIIKPLCPHCREELR